ncbi:MAG: hypothetical protein C5B56_08315 [Proteobacteria bacterium]|nr:MAG: hypothetical protein C5B56_08315 [Pseudomonadota bacterium]
MADDTTSRPADPAKKAPADLPTAEDYLGGENFRGEVSGCPTGLSRPRGVPLEPDAPEPPGPEYKPEVEELKGSRATGRAK